MEKVITYIILGLGIASTVISVALTVLNQIKSRRKATVDIVDSDNNKVGATTSADGNKTHNKRSKGGLEIATETLEKILEYITSAEQLFNSYAVGKCGDKKLATVLQNIKVDCLSNKEKFDETKWTEVVNKLVEFTKTVNK